MSVTSFANAHSGVIYDILTGAGKKPCLISKVWDRSIVYNIWLGPTMEMNWHIISYSASHDNWCTVTLWNRIMTAQCEGMGEVGSARYEPALLPPCPSIRVLSYSNCQRSTHSSRRAWQCKCYILVIWRDRPYIFECYQILSPSFQLSLLLIITKFNYGHFINYYLMLSSI